MPQRSIGETRIETQQLVRLLCDLKDDETATYETLSAAVGIDVQDAHRGLLETAIKHAEAATKRMFGTVFNVGIKRLTPGQSSGELTRARDTIRRKARRAFARSANIDYEKLTDSEKLVVNTERTILHFTAESTSNKNTKRLESAVAANNDALSYAKTIEHFK